MELLGIHRKLEVFAIMHDMIRFAKNETDSQSDTTETNFFEGLPNFGSVSITDDGRSSAIQYNVIGCF